jgi:hypothetical protein
LTLALLARASWSENPRILLVLAGFSAACMVFIHLLSAIFLPLFLAYYCFFARKNVQNRNFFLQIFSTLKYVGVGALICLVVCGSVFVYQVNGPFFFFLPQVKILLLDSTSNYQFPIDYLLTSGYWLTMHVAALAAALPALVWLCIGKALLVRSVTFWLATGPVLYGLLAVLTPDGLWFLASRHGLYATFFLPLTYLALGALLFRNNPINSRAAGMIVAVFLGSVATRLYIGDGTGIQTWVSVPMIIVSLVIGMTCFVSFAFGSQMSWVSPAAACIIGIATFAIPWKFDGNTSVFQVYEVVAKKAQGRLPKFFWSKSKDAPSDVDFASITASFTERAWWQRGLDFPDCSQPDGGSIESGDLIVILTRVSFSTDSLAEFAECVGDIRQAGSAMFKDRNGDYQLQFFEVPQDGRKNTFYRKADKLPSQTGIIKGSHRLAHSSESKEGFLTFGPYVDISPGRYILTLTYATHTESHWWDAVSFREGKIVSLAQGNLPDTKGKVSDLKVEMELSETAKRFEMRTYFSGQGDLEVHKVVATRVVTQ